MSVVLDQVPSTIHSGRGQSVHATESEERQGGVDIDVVDGFPEGGLRAWTVVFGSFCIIFSTWGLVNSLGVFQAYWQSHQLSDYPSSTIGWIGAINIFLNLLLGVQVGPLFDRYGPRYILLIGSVGYILAFLLIAQSTQYWHFLLCYGVLAGICAAMLTTTAISVVAHYFQAKRGQASGLVFIGSSLGGVVFPLSLEPLLNRLGWTWSIRIVALVILVTVTIGNICIRGRLPKGRRAGIVDLHAFLDSRFTWATFGIASFEFVVVGAIGLLPTYALYSGFDFRASYNVIAIFNGGSCIGRFVAGRVAGAYPIGYSCTSDKYGKFNAMLLTLLLSLIVVFALGVPIASRLALLYCFAGLFGLGSGSVISLAPVCFGQLCHANQYGQYYGTGYSVVSFATLICIPIGGALLPAIGAQGLLAFFGGVLVLSFVCFSMARWACLQYTWKWKARV